MQMARLSFVLALLLLVSVIVVDVSAEGTKKKKAAAAESAAAPAPAASTEKKPRKAGLPGITPAKKAATEVKIAAKTGVTNPPAPPAPYNEYRLKLQEAYCPHAEPAEKETLACRSYAITKQMKATTSPETKKSLAQKKLNLYQSADKKSDADKKTATQALKALYTKAYARYCISSRIKTDDACTNPLMKRMYGGIAKEEKKAAKAKKQ